MNDITQLSTLYSNAIARAEKAEEALRAGVKVKPLDWTANLPDFKATSATGEWLIMNEGGRWNVFLNFKGVSHHSDEVAAKSSAQKMHESLVLGCLIPQTNRVTVAYAFCCPGSVKYCDCVNKNHGTAVMGENEAGDDYPIISSALAPPPPVRETP